MTPISAILGKLRRSPRTAGEPFEAVWNGRVIARSPATVVVEGNHYFPPESVRWQLLRAAEKQTVCPWKGTASYYAVEVGDERAENAAWTYRDPKPAAAQIQDYIAFARAVDVRAAEPGS